MFYIDMSDAVGFGLRLGFGLGLGLVEVVVYLQFSCMSTVQIVYVLLIRYLI